MKKIIFISLLIMVILIGSSYLIFFKTARPEITVTIDSKKTVTFLNAQPLISGKDTLFFPVQEMAEALGDEMNWDKKSGQVLISKAGKPRVVFKIGESKATVNGEEKTFEGGESRIKYSKVYVPWRFISEVYAVIVDWDRENHKVNIITRTGDYCSSPDCCPI